VWFCSLVDKHDYHTFQPLLYQVATEELSSEQVGFLIRDVLHFQILSNMTQHLTLLKFLTCILH
jgi:NADH dehydrogenase FAD-containing subunit